MQGRRALLIVLAAMFAVIFAASTASATKLLPPIGLKLGGDSNQVVVKSRVIGVDAIKTTPAPPLRPSGVQTPVVKVLGQPNPKIPVIKPPKRGTDRLLAAEDNIPLSKAQAILDYQVAAAPTYTDYAVAGDSVWFDRDNLTYHVYVPPGLPGHISSKKLLHKLIGVYKLREKYMAHGKLKSYEGQFVIDSSSTAPHVEPPPTTISSTLSSFGGGNLNFLSYKFSLPEQPVATASTCGAATKCSWSCQVYNYPACSNPINGSEFIIGSCTGGNAYAGYTNCSHCTLGFMVLNNGTPGFMTAGHCVLKNQDYNGNVVAPYYNNTLWLAMKTGQCTVTTCSEPQITSWFKSAVYGQTVGGLTPPNPPYDVAVLGGTPSTDQFGSWTSVAPAIEAWGSAGNASYEVIGTAISVRQNFQCRFGSQSFYSCGNVIYQEGESLPATYAVLTFPNGSTITEHMQYGGAWMCDDQPASGPIGGDSGGPIMIGTSSYPPQAEGVGMEVVSAVYQTGNGCPTNYQFYYEGFYTMLVAQNVSAYIGHSVSDVLPPITKDIWKAKIRLH